MVGTATFYLVWYMSRGSATRKSIRSDLSGFLAALRRFLRLRVSERSLGMRTGSKYGPLFWAPNLFLVLMGFKVWSLVLCMVCNGYVRIPD